MSSFLEKLKKGTKSETAADAAEETDIETDGSSGDSPAEEESEPAADSPETDETASDQEEASDEEKPKKTGVKKTKKTEKKLGALEVKSIPSLEEPEEQPAKEKKEWLNAEGQLGVDVFQTENELVIQSAIAGIKTEDLDVLIEEDVLTIKGQRDNPYQVDTADYFIQECYWGPFSRKIILPVEVDSSKTDAAMKDGILTIRIPKIQREKKKRITIKG